MDCDDADALSYGTPLATEEDEDEAPRKKPVPIEQQEVRDERGLRRFHGAFTGGFSAGYFNTVGTKEGWTPRTFLSSRAERAGKHSQRPEDYMDTEDLGVFGIAPRAIQVNKEFAEEKKGGKGARKRQMTFNEGPIPGLPPLKDLIVPSSESAGVKLLRRMGWKPGQGIGPRVKTRKKRKPKNSDITEEPETPGVKIYGCFLPKDVSLQEDSDDEEILRGITFAPDDVEVMSYKAKDDFHGIGYTGLDRNPILATFHSGKTAIAPPPVRDKKKKLAITGEAFGVGVYEEDDENIYCMDDMTQYDFELGAGLSSRKVDKNKVVKGDLKKGVSRVCEVLEGFHIAAKPRTRKKRYPPPDLPRNFQPIHQKAGTVSEPVKHEMTFMDRHRMTASERAEIVGTENPKSSVFDYLRPEDKDRLLSMSNKNRTSTATDVASAPPVSTAPAIAPPASAPRALVSSAPVATPPRLSSATGRNRTTTFQPFAKDENKQKRYELYLKFKDDKKEDSVFQKLQPSNMTEWEKLREVEEFRLASAIYKPLAHGMALRFVTAKQADFNADIKEAVAKAKTSGIADTEKLAAEKVVLDYGKATRTLLAWHPDRLLCRRFNVPNPYPESTLVGTVKFKRDRFSVFNLFGVAGRKTTVGEDLLAIELPKEPEPLASSSRNDYVPTPPAAPKVERINPLTHLNEMNTKPTGFTNVSTPSQQEDVVDDKSEKDEIDKSEKDEMSRPPLDLFKAIFQNTDSEGGSPSSSSEDEANEDEAKKDTDVAKQETIPAVKAISLADEIRNHSVAMRTYAPAIPRPKSGLFSDLYRDTMGEPPVGVSTDNAQKRLASVAVVVPSSANDSNYGPVLPPHLLRQSNTDVAGDRDHKHTVLDKKSSHKSKHKHKHKKHSKSKHGKYKREKNRNDSESSSHSEASETDLNRLIKTRLKKYKRTDVK